jgi:hypothetical protein
MDSCLCSHASVIASRFEFRSLSKFRSLRNRLLLSSNIKVHLAKQLLSPCKRDVELHVL